MVIESISSFESLSSCLSLSKNLTPKAERALTPKVSKFLLLKLSGLQADLIEDVTCGSFFKLTKLSNSQAMWHLYHQSCVAFSTAKRFILKHNYFRLNIEVL